MLEFEQTGLWRRSLGTTSDLPALSKLRSAYTTFRTRAAALTGMVASSLPDLTIHDVTHLDALWETADLIAGDDYPINPAEAFVFGGSILLHDAALCFEAYEGGRTGLRSTLQWKDAFAAISANAASTDLNSHERAADFAAMRALHAKRAEDLAAASWTNPEGERLYLIESHELRKHYGRLIGLIAASHHWPIEDLIAKLPNQVNSLASMPLEWRVDPIKLACLLRCADAAHIDERRAPDFLRSLLTLRGLSAHHWTAQNWLQRVDADTADTAKQAILFTSGRAFDESNSEAWWVAYEALQLVDRELKSSAQLLRDRPQASISPPFKMQRVTGANSPEEAAKYIVAEGWLPRAVAIHVSNLEHLIAELGGDKLYGGTQKLAVVLRELIQNARDAVVARRAMDRNYIGKITVRMSKSTRELYIEDDGIGMSYRVATGPLLDFGSSFWASDLVKTELPGLLSTGYKSVGKFGIGFYSVFMAASSVVVSTRRFEAGMDAITQVKFPDGLSLRPIVALGLPDNFPSYASTQVKILVDEALDHPSQVLVTEGRPNYEPEIKISMRQCLANICAGLDVSVELVADNEEAIIVHRPLSEITSVDDKLLWLANISGCLDVSELIPALREHAGRLRPIKVDGKTVGLAALSIERLNGRTVPGTIATVGGLSGAISFSDMSRYVGAIDFEAGSAKRDVTNNWSGGEEVKLAWASEQIELLKVEEIDPLRKLYATVNLADMQCDPIEIAVITINFDGVIKFYELDEAIDLILSRGIVFYQSHMLEHVETHHNAGAFGNYPTFWPIINSSFLSLRRDAAGSYEKFSVISCLERRASERGIRLNMRTLPDRVRSYFGAMLVQVLEPVS